MQSVAEEFRQFVKENFLFGQMNGTFSDQDSLLEKGIIDSTGVLELIAFMEKRYQIKFEDSDLVPDNLDTVERLVDFVERKRSQTSAAGASHAGSVIS